MSSTSDIAKTLGKARIAREVGRSRQAVSNAIERGYFPAYWRPVIERLARDAEVEVGDHNFFSVRPVPSKSGNAA